MVKGNFLKRQLERGVFALGYQLRYCTSPDVVAMAKRHGYDFIYLDLEQGKLPVDAVAELCGFCLEQEIGTFVRVPADEMPVAWRLKNAGAQGFIWPKLRGAEHLRQVVSQFWDQDPHDRDGTAPHPVWGNMSRSEVKAWQRENILHSASVENMAALDEADAIAAIPGIHVISVGSSDLSANMGISKSENEPRLRDAYRRVVAAAKKSGKYVRLGGIYTETFPAIALEHQSDLLLLTGDKTIETDMKAAIQRARKDVAPG